MAQAERTAKQPAPPAAPESAVALRQALLLIEQCRLLARDLGLEAAAAGESERRLAAWAEEIEQAVNGLLPADRQPGTDAGASGAEPGITGSERS